MTGKVQYGFLFRAFRGNLSSTRQGKFRSQFAFKLAYFPRDVKQDLFTDVAFSRILPWSAPPEALRRDELNMSRDRLS